MINCFQILTLPIYVLEQKCRNCWQHHKHARRTKLFRFSSNIYSIWLGDNINMAVSRAPVAELRANWQKLKAEAFLWILGIWRICCVWGISVLVPYFFEDILCLFVLFVLFCVAKKNWIKISRCYENIKNIPEIVKKYQRNIIEMTENIRK